MSTSILDRAYSRSSALASADLTRAVQLKQAGGLPIVPSMNAGGFGAMQSQAGNKRRYDEFRSWTYAAVHALAKKAAGQAVNVARIKGAKPQEEERRAPSEMKHFLLQKMPPSLRTKMVKQELEMLVDHPLIDLLDQPNPVQTRWQFVYSFVANLNMTGRAYLVADRNKEGRPVIWSLPTTWVIPDHKGGPFSKFKIVNPKDPTGAGDAKLIPKENVGMAYLPDPSNPLGAMPPVLAQMNALRIDDHIQTSQEAFFENGIFPSMIVKIGAQPMGTGVPMRPMLSPAQRRQITAAISKELRGVYNYGNVPIVDGLIESYDRMSATQNEMGWEKSEGNNRTRILSSFGVHPLILGEPLNVGGYAQSTTIMDIFCGSVNVFLDMLTQVANGFIAPMESDGDLLRIWWELCDAVDPSIYSKEFVEARKMNDVSRNEFRTRLGLPPDEAVMEGRSKLLETVGGMNGVSAWLTGLARGEMTVGQVVQLMVEFLEISEERAKQIVGTGEEKPIGEMVETLQAVVEELKKPCKVELSGNE